LKKLDFDLKNNFYYNNLESPCQTPSHGLSLTKFVENPFFDFFGSTQFFLQRSQTLLLADQRREEVDSVAEIFALKK
jgi:hypothetical protein